MRQDTTYKAPNYWGNKKYVSNSSVGFLSNGVIDNMIQSAILGVWIDGIFIENNVKGILVSSGIAWFIQKWYKNSKDFF